MRRIAALVLFTLTALGVLAGPALAVWDGPTGCPSGATLPNGKRVDTGIRC